MDEEREGGEDLGEALDLVGDGDWVGDQDCEDVCLLEHSPQIGRDIPDRVQEPPPLPRLSILHYLIDLRILSWENRNTTEHNFAPEALMPRLFYPAHYRCHSYSELRLLVF